MPLCNYARDFGKPSLPLCLCAGHDNTEGSPIDVMNTAQIEYAILPDQFQWVAKDGSLSFCVGIGGVEDSSRPSIQETSWNSFSLVPFNEFVGDPRPNYSINPSLQNSRGLPPPIWVNYDNA
jgi:hypothetical protein